MKVESVANRFANVTDGAHLWIHSLIYSLSKQSGAHPVIISDGVSSRSFFFFFYAHPSSCFHTPYMYFFFFNPHLLLLLLSSLLSSIFILCVCILFFFLSLFILFYFKHTYYNRPWSFSRHPLFATLILNFCLLKNTINTIIIFNTVCAQNVCPTICLHFLLFLLNSNRFYLNF